MDYQSQAPNMLHVVEDAARKYPGPFADCHYFDRGRRAYVFIEILASILHYQYDRRWGLNGKRGNTNDKSADALSFKAPASPAGGVEVYDVVGGAGENNRPAWIDQTMETVRRGTIGAFIQPRPLADILAEIGEKPTDPDEPSTPDPDIPAIPPQSGFPPEVLRVLQSLEARMAAVEQGQQQTNGGVGQLAGQLNDLNTELHTLIGNAVKRVFGQLVEDGGVQHAGIAQEAAEKTVALLYEKNGEPGGALRVKLPNDLGGLFGRRGLVADPDADK